MVCRCTLIDDLIFQKFNEFLWIVFFVKLLQVISPAKILKETSHSISFLDAFPLAKGHVLVIPKKSSSKNSRYEQ